MNKRSSPKYRILTMDGGGVRGALTARLLERLQTASPGFLDQVNLFAGTSTGSILALGIASGLSPTQMVNLYRTQSAVLFHEGVLHEVGALWGLHGAKYSTENRRTAIYPSFKDITLGQIKKKVLVATFQLDSQNPIAPDLSSPRRWKAKFFHNFPGKDSDGKEKAIDVIMRSSAAPTYFPIYQGFIDGGVVANNPSMCALAQAIDPRSKSDGASDIKDIVLLSVGTGTKPQFINNTAGDWGLSQWGFNLVDLLFEAGSGLADYQCQQLLGDCYRRLDPPLTQPIGLDAVDKIDQLIALADGYNIQPILTWLTKQW